MGLVRISKENEFLKFYKILVLIIFCSCDFSSQLHKEILLAQDSIGEQKYEQSILRYKNIIMQYPPKKVLVKIYYQLGDLYSIHMGDPSTAIVYYEKLKEVTEDLTWLVKAEEKLGDINYTYLKDYKAAIKNYEKLGNFLPVLEKHDFYEYRLGLVYLGENKVEESKKIFLKISSSPDHAYHIQSFYYLGVLYFQNKEWDQAIKYFFNYISREKRRDRIIQAKFLMANAYESKESLEEAYDIYYSILGEYPNTEVIKNRLKSLYVRRIARKR